MPSLILGGALQIPPYNLEDFPTFVGLLLWVSVSRPVPTVSLSYRALGSLGSLNDGV